MDKNKLKGFIQSGGCLLTGHYHNWELLGSFLRNQGLPLVGLFTPLKSPFWNKQLIRWRKQIDLPAISHGAARFSKNWVQQGKVFGILLDQHQNSGVPATFFKHPVSTSRLPLFLLKNNSCSFYGVFLQGNHRVRVVRLYNPNKNHQHTPSSLLLYQRYHKVLETLIKQEPHLWYGFTHKRFKLSHSYSPSLKQKRKVSRETFP